MTNNANLVKTYTDRNYKHATMARHQGKVIAFAMDDARRICYTILDASTQDQEKGVFDAKYWSRTPQELVFPAEITQVGYSLIANTPMPTVKRDTREEAEPGELLPREIDPFLSTTARLTADAPFQVLSDGQYLYVFRQSLETNHADMVYKLADGNASGDTSRADVQFMTSDGKNVPLVNETLLVDRFILAGPNLVNVREIRYRRSGHKTRPQGAKDSLGAVDMEKKPFFEPTYELDFIDNLEGGRFSVLLLPTKVPDIKRWQFFTHNGASGRIDSVNLERSAEGLFDTRGTRFYTSPDPQYRSSVFEKEPGECPFTKKPLIPVATSTGHAEYCLAFDGSGDHVEIPNLGVDFEAITLEAWVWLDNDSADSGTILQESAADDLAFTLYVSGGELRAGSIIDGAWNRITEGAPFPKEKWVHVAASYDGGRIRLYRDGEEVAISPDDLDYSLPNATKWFIGNSFANADGWKCRIDEARIWNMARSAHDIHSYKGQRLLGDEPGLVGYWRLDEGSGKIAHDQTNGAHHGDVCGDPAWVASTAPIDDSPGMRRTSFIVEDRDVAAGMSALLYFQQEDPEGDGKGAGPLKKQARVMLAVPTAAKTGGDKKPYLATLDLGVSQEGRLAQAPDVLALPAIDHDMNAKLEAIAAKERALAALREQVTLRALGKQTLDSSETSVAISGDSAVVGVQDVDLDGNENVGMAYIFERDRNGQWRQVDELKANDGGRLDRFGYSVSIEGGRALIGGLSSDAAYIFERGSDGKWHQIQKLVVNDQQRTFGYSVSMEGDRAVIGAPTYRSQQGATYIFERDSNDKWNEIQKLTASDGALIFGGCVSLSGDRLLIGTDFSVSGEFTHGAYIFERGSDGRWRQKQKLTPSDGDAKADSFGGSVSVDGDRIVIGARAADIDGEYNAGAAYIFERGSDGEWHQKQKLTASDRKSLALFGADVSLSDNRAVIGALWHNTAGNSDAGAAYIFERGSDGVWHEQFKLIGDGKKYDWFGASVSAFGSEIAVGNGKGGVHFFTTARLPESLARQKQLEEEIKELRAGLGGDVAESMPVLATDVSGLTVSGSLLKFAYADTPPRLFARSDGLVGLYFRGTSGRFYGASFDPTVGQARFALAAGSNKLFLQARAAGAEMSDTAIAVTDGARADTCRLVIRNTGRGITETWNDVPREAGRFQQVINGEAGRPVYVGRLASAASGTVTSLTLTTGGLDRALPENAILRVGDTRLATSAALPRKATDVTVASAEFEAAIDTPIYWIPYDYAQAIATPNRYGLHNGSVLARAHAPQAAGNDHVANGAAVRTKTGAGGVWAAEAPGSTYRFDGENNYLALPDGKTKGMDIEGDATLEAWVRPASGGGTGRVLHHHGDGSRYALGIMPGSVPSALRFDGRNDYVKVAPSPAFDLTNGTLEAWIKPEWELKDQFDPAIANPGVVAVRDANGVRCTLQIGCTRKAIGTYNGSAYREFEVSLRESKWYHVALIGKGESMEVYVDGKFVGSQDNAFGSRTDLPLHIGSCDGSQEFFRGKIDEVRIWNVARSGSDIAQYKDRAINGAMPGLAGCWRFTGGEATDYSGNGRHGTLSGFTDVNDALEESPISAWRPFAAFGDRFIKATDAFPVDAWRHLAAVYDQAYALAFDGRDDYLEVDHDDSLNITEDLTIEAIIQPDRLDRTQLILGKGDPGKETQVPYWLELTTGGGIDFIQEGEEGGREILSASGKLTAGTAHRIAVVRRKVRDMNAMGSGGMSGSNDVTGMDSTGSYTSSEQGTIDDAMKNDYVEGKKKQKTRLAQKRGGASMPGDMSGFTAGLMSSRLEMELYVDGVQVASRTLDPAVLPDHNGRALHMGGTESGHYFQGALSELRLWNSARAPEQLHKPLQQNEYGLAGWWKLEENQGNVAHDAKGNSHALIQGARWIKDPRPEGSSLELYVDGERQKTEALAADHALVKAGWGDRQFTLGARRDGGEVADAFAGEIEEARIWKRPRAEEQLLDNLFSRLKEDRRDLAGYYTFDTGTETEVLDSGLLGNHLPLGTGDARPAKTLSTAPISTDTSEVRPALAGVATDFHRAIDSAPAVAEYGDMQYDAEGNFLGVMKRCYGYIDDGKWRLVTGYKVGNLVREWIGQAQFDPQVIGFIEGAPPVPSENMTYGTNGTGTGIYEGDGSGITFTQADEVNYSYSTGREQGYQSSMEFTSKFGATGKVTIMAAPMGFGIGTEVEMKKYLQGSTTFESEGAQAEEQGFSSGVNRARSLELTLGGNWEDPKTDNQLNSYLGRRWAPANMGIALVQSETADMFALRLAHNRALVSYSLRPNPDIPRDWNLLPFPLNPRYIKQGTLDGKVGFDEQGSVVEDPDYQNIAKEYGEHSYFKPREAYAIKRRIEQEEQRLATYYENFDASPMSGMISGLTDSKVGSGVGGILASAGAMGAATSALGLSIGTGLVGAALGSAATINAVVDTLRANKDLARKFSKRNLANTYVWTADGGFYAETSETTDVVQESASGNVNFTSGASGGFGMEIDAPVIFEFEANAGINLGMTNTRSKTKEASKTFSLEVSIAPSGDMQYHRPDDGEGEYDGAGNPRNVHGRVDAYRFMTFYLDGSSDNFDALFNKVVDPIWLEQSSSPFAMAMRQARNVDKKPPCWRVLHRVTFVSRVLPEFSNDAPSSLEKTMRAENIASNWQLIKTLDPFVRPHTGNVARFGQAVDNALQNYLPELYPHRMEVKQYMALYYGIADA